MNMCVVTPEPPPLRFKVGPRSKHAQRDPKHTRGIGVKIINSSWRARGAAPLFGLCLRSRAARARGLGREPVRFASAQRSRRFLSNSLVGWLVDSPPSPHAPPRLASPSRRERGECSAAEGHRRRRLRVRRRPAPPEPTGPRHRGRLAGDRPKKRKCAFTRSNSSRNLDFLNAFASPLQVVKRSNCAFSTVRGQRLSPAVDNDSLEVTTSTRSRTRSSRRDGRCACHARPST